MATSSLLSSKEAFQTQLFFDSSYLYVYILPCQCLMLLRGLWFAVLTFLIAVLPLEKLSGGCTWWPFLPSHCSFSEFVTWHNSQHLCSTPKSQLPREPPGWAEIISAPFCWLALPFSCMICMIQRSNTYLLLLLFKGQLWVIPEGRWPSWK